MFRPGWLMAVVLVGALLGGSASGQQTPPGTLLEQVGFDQKLNGQVPLDLRFQDENGDWVRLGDVFSDRPVILTLVYYNCPMLCTQVLNGLTRTIRPLSLELGEDFDIVTVSINPAEKSELSALKKRAYLEQYGRPEGAKGWHFLTGAEPQIRQLADAVGFRYTYNPSTRLFAHAAGIMVITPKGVVARYLFGIDYSPRDLQFALLEASAERIGSPVARILLLCYDYDSASGKYTMAIMRITRILGSLTVLVLLVTILFLFRWEKRRAARLFSAATPDESATASARN